MKCLGRHVTYLIFFYFEKWQKNSPKITNFSCLLSLFEKTIRQKGTNTLWNTAISPISHKSSAASKSTSTGAQYVTLDNKSKCLNLPFYFGNLTNKTVTGTAYMWGLLIANHLDQSL
jgi:hypothetical protein